MDWNTTITYTGVDPLTQAQAQALAETAATTVHEAATARLSLTLTGRPADPGMALPLLERAGVNAEGAEVVHVCCTRADETEHQLLHPTLRTLVNTTEAAQILGFSRQRAAALLGPDSAKRDPNAPTPLARTGNGPVWERGAIELYALRRDPSADPWKHRR